MIVDDHPVLPCLVMKGEQRHIGHWVILHVVGHENCLMLPCYGRDERIGDRDCLTHPSEGVAILACSDGLSNTNGPVNERGDELLPLLGFPRA